MIEEGVAYAGNDIRGFQLDDHQTADDCAALCMDDDGCKFWSLTLLNNMCYFKTSDAGRSALDTEISGLKPCN